MIKLNKLSINSIRPLFPQSQEFIVCVALLLFMLFISITTAAYANASSVNFTIKSLSQAFSKQQAVNMPYVQRQILNFSDQPIQSSGYLIYKAPDYFSQIEQAPKQRTFIAKDGWLMVTVNGSLQRRVKLTSYPNMQIQLSTLKSVLSGNIISLKEYFFINLQGSISSWILSLKPKPSELGTVNMIQINGQQGNISAIALHYNNGNITTLSLTSN